MYKYVPTSGTHYVMHNPNAIKNFYRSLKYSHFLNLTPERAKEIDGLVDKWRYFFETDINSIGQKMTFASERLTTSAKQFKLFTGDEALYFYIKMIDPDFLFLEAYESANTREQFVALCKRNFGIVDSIFTHLEKEINSRFQMYKAEDLWSRDHIDKNIEQYINKSPRK